MSSNPLPEGAIRVLDDGFIKLVDHMGSDDAIVQAARVSYGKGTKKKSDDRGLIRYLMRHWHTTPFEMVEFKFLVRVPMDAWRQWIRHRTANVNEYSTRYSEAIDSQQKTAPDQWRSQSKKNKQGSSDSVTIPPHTLQNLTDLEDTFHKDARLLYEERLSLGIAREQARKDLPLSTYTEAYWKCDLHNIFHFLRLRLDPHAQLEIREYANAMYELIKPIVPIACQAFEDYRLGATQFSKHEMDLIISALHREGKNDLWRYLEDEGLESLSKRELAEFKKKLEL